MSEGNPRGGWLPIIREMYTGVIALVILVLFLFMVWRALDQVSGNGTAFQSVKELLAIVNPIVGLVIGYYFSRVSTEARAENAEIASAESTRVAIEATQAKEQNAQEAKTANEKSSQLRGALVELTGAVLETRSEASGSEQLTHTPPLRDDSRLGRALQRAEALVS